MKPLLLALPALMLWNDTGALLWFVLALSAGTCWVCVREIRNIYRG